MADVLDRETKPGWGRQVFVLFDLESCFYSKKKTDILNWNLHFHESLAVTMITDGDIWEVKGGQIFISSRQ